MPDFFFFSSTAAMPLRTSSSSFTGLSYRESPPIETLLTPPEDEFPTSDPPSGDPDEEAPKLEAEMTPPLAADPDMPMPPPPPGVAPPLASASSSSAGSNSFRTSSDRRRCLDSVLSACQQYCDTERLIIDPSCSCRARIFEQKTATPRWKVAKSPPNC